MLASVVLEPESHRKLKELVEDQKHSQSQGSYRPSSKNSSAIAATSTPTKILNDETIAAESDDGGSDRTSSLWAPSAALDESAMQNLSMEQILAMQKYLQREVERRMRGSSVSSPSTGTPLPPPALLSTQQQQQLVDQHAIESRKGLKRSKSGGNESASAFVYSAHGAANGVVPPAGSSSARRLQQSRAALELQQAIVEKEDPELMSVHSDALYANTPHTTGRTASRTNGALHPHDKMIYGHRGSALPCLSPLEGAVQSSPLESIMMNNASSRGSSRPPSRGSHSMIVGSLEDRLLSTSINGSASLGGNMLTAAALAFASADLQEDPLSTQMAGQTSFDLRTGAPYTAPSQHQTHMPLDQLLSRNQMMMPLRENSGISLSGRQDLVLSPFSAFDDLSLDSSISSKPRRRHTASSSRRESTQSTSTIESTTFNTPNPAVRRSSKQ